MSYKVLNTSTNIETDCEDLYEFLDSIITDNDVEDFVNECYINLNDITFLDRYGSGTLIKYLAYNIYDPYFETLWKDFKEDYLQCTYDSILDDLSWNGETKYQDYLITEIEEEEKMS